jgi:hypothetical protein
MSELRKRYRLYCDEIDKKSNELKKAKLTVLANALAKFEKGQIISTSTQRIIITGITGSLTIGEPNIVYIGTALTKKNQPRKSGEKGYVYTDEEHKGIELIKF